MKMDCVWDKLNVILTKKGRRCRRRVDRPTEVNASTHPPPSAQVEVGRVSTREAVEYSGKRKIVSPPEDRKVDDMKRSKRGDTSYAEICSERSGLSR